jgi:hypothetical protein
MPSPYTPNSNLPFGGTIFTISGITYVVEGDTTFDHNTREIQRRDQNGDESDFMIRAEPSKMSAKLQLATSVTTLPTLGATFTAPGPTAFAAAAACVVTSVKQSYPQGGIWYCDINYRAISLVTT